MSLIFSLLTIVLFVDCLFLTLLILMQLPKKEAGLGQAFGSGATDALFGAGSGNVLTKVTRYCATIFFVLALVLSIMGPRLNEERVRQREFLKTSKGNTSVTPTPTPTPTPANLLVTPVATSAVPVVPATNAATNNK